MRTYLRWLQVAALSLAVAIAAAFFARLLLSPATGEIVVLASARQPDRIGASTVELHSASGWLRLGDFNATGVPAAPGTATLVGAKAPIGTYDAIRLGGRSFPATISVRKTALETVLVAVSQGLPAAGGVYAGGESVSLGLNELSGQMKAMPDFALVDQFGRSFTRDSILGHDAIVAAFHTTCRESCPIYTGLFLQLRRELPASVLLVEATTDPWTDTPQVLRDYAGRIGASWTFLTGDPAALSEFWKPFDVELSTGDVHRSTLAVIDAHGYIRSYYLGTPDVDGQLAPELAQLLNDDGEQLLRSHGSGWGLPQVLDSLRAIGGLRQPGSGDQGPAPDFALFTLDGRSVSLSDFRGRPVVINFWATYCMPCRREMPMLQRVANAHPTMVLLLIDERDDRGAATSFAKDLDISATVLFDSDGKVGDLYQVGGLPTTVFVRSDGSIEGRYLGETNEQILGPHLSAIGA